MEKRKHAGKRTHGLVMVSKPSAPPFDEYSRDYEIWMSKNANYEELPSEDQLLICSMPGIPNDASGMDFRTLTKEVFQAFVNLHENRRNQMADGQDEPHRIEAEA